MSLEEDIKKQKEECDKIQKQILDEFNTAGAIKMKNLKLAHAKELKVFKKLDTQFKQKYGWSYKNQF